MIAKTNGKKFAIVCGCRMICFISNDSFQYHTSTNNIRLALFWAIRFMAQLHYTELMSCRLQSTCKKENGVSIKRGLNRRFADSLEAVAQSVSALCFVSLLWLWVQVLLMARICFVCGISFLLPSIASLAEIIQNSHLFSQEKFEKFFSH